MRCDGGEIEEIEMARKGIWDFTTFTTQFPKIINDIRRTFSNIKPRKHRMHDDATVSHFELECLGSEAVSAKVTAERHGVLCSSFLDSSLP